MEQSNSKQVILSAWQHGILKGLRGGILAGTYSISIINVQLQNGLKTLVNQLLVVTMSMRGQCYHIINTAIKSLESSSIINVTAFGP